MYIDVSHHCLIAGTNYMEKKIELIYHNKPHNNHDDYF